MSTSSGPKTSGPVKASPKKRKVSKARGKDYDEFLQAELTKFVGKGGPTGGRVGPPIGLPAAVPLAQYGEHLIGAASAVKASHLRSPQSPISAAAPANAGPQSGPFLGAPQQWPGHVTQWPGHLAHYHTEDLATVAGAGKASSNAQPPVAEDNNAEGGIASKAAKEAQTAAAEEKRAAAPEVMQEAKSLAVLADVKAKQEVELLALEEALARAEAEEEANNEAEAEAEALALAEEAELKAKRETDAVLAAAKAKQEAEIRALEEALAEAEEMERKQDAAAQAAAEESKLKEVIPAPTIRGVDGTPTPELDSSSESDDEILELPERGPGGFDGLLHRPSVVREYEGLLDDLDDYNAHHDTHEEDKEKAPDTPPEVEEAPTPTEQILPVGEKAVETAPVEVVNVGGGKGLKFTVAVELDAAGLSGDLGQYADTSWSLTSPRAGSVNARQDVGLGDATPPNGMVRISRDVQQTGRENYESREKRLPLSKLLETPASSSMSVQDQKVLRWFRRHDFGRLWKIDCDFKLRHKIANGYMVGACLAEYHKGQVSKEDFNRGNGPANKTANWEFIQKFMRRRGFSLCQDDVECLSTVPMPIDAGAAAACRVLSSLYSFLLADGHVPPLAGIAPARLRALPARPKKSLYKRFTDRRRSDLEEEALLAADANAFRGTDGNPCSSRGGRRSSSVPVTLMRRATLVDAEEFHKSRRSGRGPGEGRGTRTRDAGGRPAESESQKLRRRHYAPDEDLVDVNPTTGETEGGGGGDENGGRTKPGLDQPGGRRDGNGCRYGGDRSGSEAARHPNELAFAGGEGMCPECARCNCCGRVAFPFMKDAFDSSKGVAEGTKGVNDEGARAGEDGRQGRDRGGRRALGGAGYGTTSGSSGDEARFSHSPDIRRDYDVIARPRHHGKNDHHDMVPTGHRSDPSTGREDEGLARRRRRRPPQRQDDDGRENGRQRYRRDELFGGNRPLQGHDDGRTHHHHRYRRDEGFDGQQRSGGGKDDRRQRVARGYGGGDVSSEEEQHMSPRRRRARREAAAAAVTNSAREEASPVPLGKKEDLARHRRREIHNVGRGNAVFSSPFSTPRRGQPSVAPPKQHLSSWRGGRRDRTTSNLERNGGGDSPALDYPALPPSALPEARRRRRRDLADPSAMGDTGEQIDDGRRRAGRRPRQEPKMEHSQGGGGGAAGSGRDRRTQGRGTMKEIQDRTASERSGARRGNERGSDGGARPRAPDQQHPMSNGKKLPSGPNSKGFVPSEVHPQARRRRERGDGGGRGAGGISRLEAPDASGAAAAAASSSTPRSPRSPRSRSPTNHSLPLGDMSGFGPGDRGWSERVENRRQQQLAQRNRASASPVAEVNNDSGKIEPLTPTAPAASFDAHHQAVSPPRLRRLVHAEEAKQPARRLRGSSMQPQKSVVPNAIARNMAQGQDPEQQQVRQRSLLPATAVPKRAGFDSYADDDATGVEVGVHWG